LAQRSVVPSVSYQLAFWFEVFAGQFAFPFASGRFLAGLFRSTFDRAGLKKPGKRGSEEEWRVYRHLKKEINLSFGCPAIGTVAKKLDDSGANRRPVVGITGRQFL
jgi:hypothetical protein